MTRPAAANLRSGDDDLGRDEIDTDAGTAPMVQLAAVEPVAVDPAQAAKLIGVSKSMFFKLVSAGRIGPAGVKLGRCVRFSLSELRAWGEAGMPPRHEWAARQGRNGGLK